VRSAMPAAAERRRSPRREIEVMPDKGAKRMVFPPLMQPRRLIFI
jgi:hypothetical protein